MKPLKAAAVLAGALVAAGAVTPAYAASDAAPKLVDDVLDTVGKQKALDAQLVGARRFAPEAETSPAAVVQGLAKQVKQSNATRKLLGGLPVG
ncbi:hypothetical protein [Streptomyces sp. TS71-3]|uniref:hypothetical protein n=1 Tax=Streptomyces sp. TS71-3 TaxID=2733862 RepID=UPI001B051C9E|nr:hypothetical protein [Streptomyces sp. TS71-3]GHJ39983.1 hypothetical protein Sm713_55920 [Streptomyces sp. TS71-3]